MQEYMDSRDLEEELQELQEIQELGEDEDFDEDRLISLIALKSETETSGWQDGITFINENSFEEYAKDFIEECCEIPTFLENFIDYESFADEMKMDYSECEFEDETYYYTSP